MESATHEPKKQSRPATVDRETATQAEREQESGTPAGMPFFVSGSSGAPPPVQPKLTINQPGDRYEQEADAVADAVMRMSQPPVDTVQRACSCGGTCARCRAGIDHDDGSPPIQRMASSNAPASSISTDTGAMLPSGGGNPLDSTTRSDFEARFGQDFGGVRVHSGPDAAERASRISARAFTAGSDIVFGAGEYAPASPDGRHLLAHELAHVVQQRSGVGPDIQRQDEDKPNPPRVDVNDFNPCGIDERELDNITFLGVLARTRRYIDDTERGEEQWYDYANLLRRLVAERKRRAGFGHIWIYDGKSAASQDLYRLETGMGGIVRVYRESGSEVAARDPHEAISPTMTESQFETFRRKNNIADLNPREFFDAQSSDEVQRPLEFRIPRREPRYSVNQMNPFFNPYHNDPFYNPFNAFVSPAPVSNLAGGQFGRSSLFGMGALPLSDRPGVNLGDSSYNKFRGSQAETMVTMGSGRGIILRENLNQMNIAGMDRTNVNTQIAGLMPDGSTPRNITDAQLRRYQGNNPVWDTVGRNIPWMGGPTLTSIKTYIPPEGTDIRDWGTYEKGFADIAGHPSRRGWTATQFYATSIGLVNEGMGANMTLDDALLSARLAVNADHVEAMRARVEERVRGNIHAQGADAPEPLSEYRNLHEADLRNQPIQIGSESFNSVDGLRGAVGSTITQSQFDEAVGELARRASSRVISNGLLTTELRNVQSYTRQYHGQLLSANQPALADSVRQGNVVTSNTRGSRRTLALDPSLQTGDLHVNSDQVSGVRTEVRRVVRGDNSRRNRALATFEARHNADLADNPLRFHGKDYTSVAELRQDASGPNPTLSQADFSSAVDQLADRMATRVVSNNLTTAQVLAVAQGTKPQLEASLFAGDHAPLVDAVRTGEWVTGADGTTQFVPDRLGATARSGLRGVKVGTGISIITEGINAYNDPNIGGWDYARNVAISGAGAGLEAGAEARLGMLISETQLARTAANPAMAASYARYGTLARGTGSTVIGAALTPAVVLSMMALDDQDYTDIEYAAAGARYGAGGAVAAGGGWLAAAGTGALLGSEVPVAGTIAGFIVGAAAFFIFDASVGDDISEGVSDALGANGCVGGIRTGQTRRPPTFSESGPIRVGPCPSCHSQTSGSDTSAFDSYSFPSLLTTQDQIQQQAFADFAQQMGQQDPRVHQQTPVQGGSYPAFTQTPEYSAEEQTMIQEYIRSLSQ